MSRKVSLLICFILVLGLCSNVLAFDQVMPDFAGGEQTAAVLWEFEDGNSATKEASDQPSLILYDPEPADACFGFRYSGFSWTGEPDPNLAFFWDSNATVVTPEEESLIQPVPDGEGANLTVQVQVMWWPGPNTPNGPGDTPYLSFSIEIWEGKGVEAEEGGEHMGGIGNEEGEIGITPIEEVNMAPGWKHSTYRHTFEDFSEDADISHVHLIFFGYEHGTEGLKLDEVVVDMVVHEDPEPPVGPGREWLRVPRAGQARDPVPANRAEHIQPNTNLSWAPDPCLAGPLTYDVWFGTDPCMANNRKIASNIGANTVDPCAGDLTEATLYYWRVDTNDAGTVHTGIDFKFTTWGLADDVYPANGAKGVDPPVLLEWGPDGYAASCDIYLGTSFAEVDSVDSTDTTGIYKGNQAVSDVNYNAGMLDLLKDYYWRIDEKNGTTIKGEVWKFTTGANFTLEDFDRYATSSQLWDVWDDYWVNGTNSQIFLEKDANFTLDGNSLMYEYDSRKSGPSFPGSVADADVADMLVGSDWTIGGIKSLVIHFMGNAGNSTTANDRMWLEIEDTSSNAGLVLYDGDMNNLAVAEWQEWNIDLGVYDACGVDLTNVDKIHLGFAGEKIGQSVAGGTGTVYFDEIELHPQRCRPEVVAWDISGDDCKTDGFDLEAMSADWLVKDYEVIPVAPDRNNLLVEYLFDTDYSDTSGNGFHGQPSATLTHVANGYLTIENTGGYVDIPFGASNPFHGPTDFSIFINYRLDAIAMTALMTSTDPCLPTDWDDPNVVDIDAVLTTYSPMMLYLEQRHTGSPSAPDDITFYYDNFFKGGTNVAKSEVEGIGSWHSVAVTYDADGGVCPDEPWDPNACPPGSVTGLFTVYIDGIKGPDPANFDPNIPADDANDIVRIGDGYNTLHVEDLGVTTHIGDFNEILIFDAALTEGEVYYLSGIMDPTYVANTSVANIVLKSPPGGPYDPNNPDIVNLMDFALLGDHWLEAPLLWP